MKILTIVFANAKQVNDSYYLPDGMNGKDWMTFKENYSFILAELIQKSKKAGSKNCIINIDELPVLCSDYGALKEFFHANKPKSVKQWNLTRDLAKEIFIAPLIYRLDSSGLITKFLKNE